MMFCPYVNPIAVYASTHLDFNVKKMGNVSRYKAATISKNVISLFQKSLLFSMITILENIVICEGLLNCYDNNLEKSFYTCFFVRTTFEACTDVFEGITIYM